jgi:hypothetical protein
MATPHESPQRVSHEDHQRTSPEAPWSRAITTFLLLLASVHCVLSIFFVNLSYLKLNDYAAGLSPLPFQRRLLMVPYVRWAQSNHVMQAAAIRFAKNLNQNEPMTAAKFACMALAIVLLCALGLYTLRASAKLGLRHRWLLWAMLLVVLYTSYAARFEQALWYPYDVPHLVLFGLGTLFLLNDEPLPFAAFMAVDVFVRETSIFLIALAFLVHFRSTKWRVAGVLTAALWGVSRLLGQHLYPHNVFEANGVPWYRMAAPWHWPQLLSIAGFLWIPVLLARRYLTPRQRLTLYGATALMLLTFFFATWNETRAWAEWSVLFATLAAIELEAAFATPAAPAPLTA